MRRQVVNAVDAGDGDVRVKALWRRIDAEPSNVAPRLELASHYERRGFPDLAVEHLRLAAEKFPESVEVRIHLARLLRKTGQLTDAANVLERFTAANEAPASLHSWLGIIRDELGEFARAETSHREALRLAPADDFLHNNLGYNLLLQGRHEEAAAEFRRALAANSNSEVARNNLGLALASSAGSEAVLYWKSSMPPATAHNNLAAVHIEQGRYREARAELDRALSFDRNHAAALANLRLVAAHGGGITAPAQEAARNSGFWKRVYRVVFGADEPPVSDARAEVAGQTKKPAQN
jgi:Flp pilus assembly protein TadD